MMFTSNTMLAHHLTYNHFPAVSLVWLPVCEQAIDAANDGEWDRELARPFPTRNGERTISVRQVIDGLHLDGFLETEGDE